MNANKIKIIFFKINVDAVTSIGTQLMEDAYTPAATVDRIIK